MEKTSFDQLLMDVFREMGAHRPERVFRGCSLSLSEIYALSILAERASLFAQLTPHKHAALLEGMTALRRILQDPAWRSRAAFDEHTTAKR